MQRKHMKIRKIEVLAKRGVVKTTTKHALYTTIVTPMTMISRRSEDDSMIFNCFGMRISSAISSFPNFFHTFPIHIYGMESLRNTIFS